MRTKWLALPAIFLGCALWAGCTPDIGRDSALEERVRQRMEEQAAAPEPAATCSVPGCSNPVSDYVAAADGTELPFCEEHEAALEAQNDEGHWRIEDGPPAEEHLCLVCGKPAVLSITDTSGVTRYYCTDHFTEIEGDLTAFGSPGGS